MSDMMALKPDRLNGEKVYRGVATEGGVNIQTSTIVFPPTMTQGPPPIKPLDMQLHEFMQRLVTISDQHGDPVLKAQVVMFKKRLERAARAALYRATLIERERIKQNLLKQAMPQAALVADS